MKVDFCAVPVDCFGVVVVLVVDVVVEVVVVVVVVVVLVVASVVSRVEDPDVGFKLEAVSCFCVEEMILTKEDRPKTKQTKKVLEVEKIGNIPDKYKMAAKKKTRRKTSN